MDSTSTSQSQEATTSLPQKLHSSTIKDAASISQDPTTSPQAYDKFLDDVIGTLPETDPFGDLDNEIHPIFRRQNFVKQTAQDSKPILKLLSNATYTRMLPALRLVSLIITQRSMCHVFDHIANSVITKDENGTPYMASGPWVGSELGYDYVQAVFKFMVTRLYIQFPLQLTLKATLCDSAILACNVPFDDNRKGLGTHTTWSSLNGLHVIQLKDEHGKEINRRILERKNVIRFQRYFLDCFEKDMQHDTSRGKLSALFFFAKVIIHEVTHAFGTHVENFFTRPPKSIEPRWSIDDPIQELGLAIEAWLFQGRSIMDATVHRKLSATGTVFPIDLLVLGPLFVLLDRSNIVHSAQLSSGSDFVLRAEQMRKWFLKSTWQDIQNGKDSHANIMRLSECTEVRVELSYLVALVNGKVVAKFDAQILWDKGWFEKWSHGSRLGEGYWDMTTSRDFNSSKE